MKKNKQKMEEYIREVKAHLPPLPQKSATRGLAFLKRRIKNQIHAGATVREAIDCLGTAEKSAKFVVNWVPLCTVITKTVMPKRELRPMEKVGLIVSSPLWILGLLLAEILMLSVYAGIAFVALMVYSVDLTLAVCTVYCVLSIVMNVLRGAILKAFLSLLVGVACFFLTLLFFAWSIRITAKALHWIIFAGAAIKTKIINKKRTA